MNPAQCRSCFREVTWRKAFYLFYVCEKCAEELKKIAHGKCSSCRSSLVFFIWCHLVFIAKNENIEIEFLVSYTNIQLYDLAQALKNATSRCILK